MSMSDDLVQAQEEVGAFDHLSEAVRNARTEPANSFNEGPKSYDVQIFWRYLTYTEEGREPVKIYIQPPNRYGGKFTFHIPGVDRWNEVMPEWAIDKRELIVERIKVDCAHFYANWTDE